MRHARCHFVTIAAIITGGALSSPANADEITISPNGPFATSEHTSGGDTLTLDDDTDLEIEASGAAGATIDTSSNVINDGYIYSKDLNNTTGVLIQQDVTSDITNTGSIYLADDDDYALEDIDDDGDLDADTNQNDIADTDEGATHTGYAVGSSRYGLWLQNGVTLTGTISNGVLDDDEDVDSGAITIQGDYSYGIRLDGLLDGDLFSPGSVTVYGDQSYGVRVGDDGGITAVTGDVTLGNISVYGEQSTGVEVADAIDGTLVFRGSVSATAYHSTSRPSDTDDADDEDGIDYYELDADDKLQSGSAVAINADVASGVMILGVGLEDDDDDDHDGLSDDDDVNDNLTGTLTIYGSAPALSISNAHIGLLSYDFSINSFGLDNGDDFGLYNRGSILAYGVFNDVAATALEVSNGAAIDGGILNDGTLYAVSYNADAYAVRFDGGTSSQLVNRNSIGATTYSNSTTPSGYVSDDIAQDDTAYAVYIGAGSNLSSITNTQTITAIGYDSDTDSDNESNATAIYDASNSLTSVTNSGSITAYVYTLDEDGNDEVEPVAAGAAIAIDARNNTQALSLTQTVNSINEDDGVDADEDDDDNSDKIHEPEIVGDILFGSGGDTINLYAGTIDGVLSFGDGSDTFNVDNGAIYSGHLLDSDGALTINVQDGRLNLTNDTSSGEINISNATFGAGSILSLELSSTVSESVFLNATGNVTFESGAQLLLTPPEGLPESGAITIVTAGGGLDAAAVLGEVTTEGGSYLYNFTVDYVSGDANSLEANYEIKTASELELNRNQTAAYSALLDALRLDDDASTAFSSLATEDDFFDAYDDLMPNYSSAMAELATTAIRQGQAASSNRLTARRLRELDEVTVWAQEIGYLVDRTAPTSSGADYSGAGFGFAFGIDGPLENGNLFGLSTSFITSEASEDGSQAAGTVAAWFLQGNAYLGSSFGPFDLDLVGGLGIGRFQSRRDVEIGDDYTATSEAEWSAYEGHGSAHLSAPIEIGRWLIVSPQATLTYVALHESGYAESGGGAAIDYNVDAAFSQRLWADAGLSFQPQFTQTGGGVIAPRLFLGYRGNLIDDPAERTVRFVSGDASFTLIDDPIGGGGPLVGLGIDSSNGATTISVAYEGEFSEQIERHSLNAALRFRF